MTNKEKLSKIEDIWKLANTLKDTCGMCVKNKVCGGVATQAECVVGIKSWLESDAEETYKSNYSTVNATNCGDYYIIHGNFTDKKVNKELFEYLFNEVEER